MMMNRLGWLLVALVSWGAPAFAQNGMDLGLQSSPDSAIRVTCKVVEPNIFAKKPTTFAFEVLEGEHGTIADATLTLICHQKVEGFVCPTDTEVQAERAGKCSKCNEPLQKGQIRKKVKESKLPFGRQSYSGKQTLDKEGEYDLELKVELPEGKPPFTVVFTCRAELWVAPKKHTCPIDGGTFPGPGNCKKCGMALVEKTDEAPADGKKKPPPKKHH